MNAQTWALIKRLRQIDNLSISEIARQTGKDRKTVREALKQQNLPLRKRSASRVSKLDPYKDYIAQRLNEYPHIFGTVLFDEMKRRGYTGKLRILWEYLEQVRKKQKEAFLRIETLPAEYAQVDWANCGSVGVGNATRKLSCFIMVLSYSRMLYLEFTLSQCLQDFIGCHINAFKFFGGIPKKILYDNLKSVVLSRLGNNIVFNPKFMEFSGIYLFEPIVCNVARGNEKGKVENSIKYLRGSFLAQRALLWPQIQYDACSWRDEIANVRIHGTTRQRPIDRFQQEKPLLSSLPDIPYDNSIIKTPTASSQALINFDGNSYSVPFSFAYKQVLLKASKNEVRIFNLANPRHILAIHQRSFERGVVIENPKHYEGLIALKKKAFASKLKDKFLSLGELAKNYLDGLIVSELNIHYHIAQIMECLHLYGKTEVMAAIDHAIRHKAFGAPYLKNIIIQQRAQRGIKENMPISIPAKPSWTKLAVEELDLSLYDDLFDSSSQLNNKLKDDYK
jgi:transposase